MLLPMRVFLAAGWLRAGVEKLIDPTWWRGTTLRGFVRAQHEQAIPFFRPVMDHAIAPGAVEVAFVVMVSQLACGLAIATGIGLRTALRWTVVLNVAFVLAGRVNPSAFYLVMEAVLLLAIADGVIASARSTPSRRSYVWAALALGFAALFVPYIRTVEPAKVIEDPAMMLTFLGTTVAATLIVRCAAHPTMARAWLGTVWRRRLARWCAAVPPHVGR
jgi:hypothetical protein